ncbi:MAG: cysteine--tRNA ligase [Candidatus Omnitrophota bacterium]|nr:cysteine--tRNA ligase [Candidatus Omnitrophota bacterium]
MITLYNTLTRKKEEFRPMEEGKVRMYVCGPTVYDVPHIGHARSAYAFDVIRRYFEYAGLEVFFVRNVTDVDDKIIKKAADELQEIGEKISSVRLKERVSEVATRYLDVYHHEMDVLGMIPPTVEPKATENISDMIEFIKALIDREYAYVAGGNVYFSVDKFADYGKLSNRDREEMLQGVRIELDEKKRYPLDFALWKEAKPMEPFWESPWGEGRPGWHIECSVMSMRILGPQFDIHGGGLDLLFPHHENEIAQAEAVTGRPFANHWIHNGLLTVNAEKMSKSLGNYITIADFLEKHRDPDLLKMAFLNSHYRSPMDYSEDKMTEVRRSKERIMIFFDKVDRMVREYPGGERKEGGSDAEAVSKAQWTVNTLQEKFEEVMNDDFNAPGAMSVIFEAVKTGNDCLSDSALSVAEKTHMANAVKNFVLRFANVLGLSLSPIRIEEDQAREIERLVTLREEARKKKDYARSDTIREELENMGVTVEDTPEGPVWRKR